MQQALQGVGEQDKKVPDGISRVRIDRNTGLLTNKLDGSSMFEYFADGTEPEDYVSESSTNSTYTNDENESLF